MTTPAEVLELKKIIQQACGSSGAFKSFLLQDKSKLDKLSLDDWQKIFQSIHGEDFEIHTRLLYFIIHTYKGSFNDLAEFIKTLDNTTAAFTSKVLSPNDNLNSFKSYLSDYFYLFNIYFLANILLERHKNLKNIAQLECVQSYLETYEKQQTPLTDYFIERLEYNHLEFDDDLDVKPLKYNGAIIWVLNNFCDITLLQKADNYSSSELTQTLSSKPTKTEPTEMTTQNSVITKTQTVIASQVDVHKDAMVQAALLEVGNTVLKTVKETIRPTLPPLAQAFLDNPIADLAIASGTAMVLTLVAPTDEKAKIAATAVLTVGYSNLLGKLQISDIISRTLGKIPDSLVKTVKGSGE